VIRSLRELCEVVSSPGYLHIDMNMRVIANMVSRSRRLLVREFRVHRLLRSALFDELKLRASARILFMHDWVVGGYEAVRSIVSRYRGTKELGDIMRKAFRKVASAFEGSVVQTLDFAAASSTPLASEAMSIIVDFWRKKESMLPINAGYRVNVTSILGGGKTTFVFWSIVAALRALNMPLDDAISAAKLVFAKDLDSFTQVLDESMDLVKKGMFVPFVVVDDAVASGLSKYEMTAAWSTNPMLRKAIAKLSQLLSVAREGVGMVIFIGHVNMLPKPIREENVDIVVDGTTSKDSQGLRHTLWTMKKPVSSPNSAQLKYKPTDFTATVVPLLRVPDDIYKELELAKLAKRAQLLMEFKQLLEAAKQIQTQPEEENQEGREE